MNQSTKIIIGAAAVVIVGGGIYAATTGQKKSDAETHKGAKLGLVLDTGGVDDHSFNQSAW
ncbi:BMP family ABC transporter substrate-binding protein, partial [Pseudomonas stutzeri]|nr:BMP family ABC transporter substrate-binding protein [Stutzerimonas stutzeri]